MTPTHEAPKEFTARANRLLAESVSLSRSHANDLSAANACMNQAKTEQMSWVEGLAYTVVGATVGSNSFFASMVLRGAQ
jgi:hypothetical protein